MSTRPDPQTESAPASPTVGRPPSALALLLGLPALLFLLITWQVVDGGQLLRVDERLSRALVHPSRTSELLSGLGNVEVAVPVLVLVAAYVAWRGLAAGTDCWWLPPLAALVLMSLVPVFVVPLKAWTDRHGTPVMPPATGYYPSGHAATAAIAYGTATMLLLPWLRSAYARRELVIACAVVNAGVGFGLISRGYHWPLDVVASWCLCAAMLCSLWIVLRVLLGRSSRPASAGTPGPHSGPR